MKSFQIKSNNLSQMAQALQLHKPGDKFFVAGLTGNPVCYTVTEVLVSESGKIGYNTRVGLFAPENCDWITTEVTE